MRSASTTVPELVKNVAKDEGIDEIKLARRLAAGKIVIPNNPIHSPLPKGIGEGLKVKVNVNIGTSPDYININEEIEKVRLSQKYGTDAIMDLSTGGNIDEIRRKIKKEVKVPLGTVPIYEATAEAMKKGKIWEMTEDDIFRTIEKHAKDGVDFMTVHCGVTMESIEKLKKMGRLTDIVSRGGSILACWMVRNEDENPLYKNYDYLLELAAEYEFTLSLGDGLRPGCIADATDAPQLQELIVLGELIKRAREKGVQAMVEGPGHIPINQIEANIRIEKTICDGAPFYVLGPIVTDIAPGYDHITSAIGAALAAYYGADFICYVTPAEHLSLPSLDDVREGLIAAKIAAHAADIARGRGVDRDYKMAKARKSFNWEMQYVLSLDPEKTRNMRERRLPKKKTQTCSMCGDFCAMLLDDNMTC